jgi:hypothetical protein
VEGVAKGLDESERRRMEELIEKIAAYKYQCSDAVRSTNKASLNVRKAGDPRNAREKSP